MLLSLGTVRWRAECQPAEGAQQGWLTRGYGPLKASWIVTDFLKYLLTPDCEGYLCVNFVEIQSQTWKGVKVWPWVQNIFEKSILQIYHIGSKYQKEIAPAGSKLLQVIHSQKNILQWLKRSQVRKLPKLLQKSSGMEELARLVKRQQEAPYLRGKSAEERRSSQ